MSHNFPHLNTDITEVNIFGKKEERLRIATVLNTEGLRANETVKNLTVIIDSDLNFSHMKTIANSTFYHPKYIFKLRGLTSKNNLEKLIHALSPAGLTTAMVCSQVFLKRPSNIFN